MEDNSATTKTRYGMRLMKNVIMHLLNVAASTIIGGTLMWILIFVDGDKFEANLYSSAIGSAFVFLVLTYILYLFYRRIKYTGRNWLMMEILFCYIICGLIWLAALSTLGGGINWKQIWTFSITINLGAVVIPLFRHYFEPIFIDKRG